MKKILFTILTLILFISILNASEYNCEINGDDIIYSNSDKTSYISINITNIEEISSFRMYIKYDSTKYKADSCQFLNYNLPSCSLRVNDSNLIFYDYNYNEEYSLNDYPFFYTIFISNDKTPTTGNSKINVYFEDAKDKNNKDITINECKKTINFEEGEGKTNIVSKTINIDITGYKLNFDEKTYDYNLRVDSNVNSLDLVVSVPEDYEYTVTGASDLNTFGNKVTINIKTKDNKDIVYTINVLKEKSSIKTTSFRKLLSNFIKNIKKFIPFLIVIVVIIIIVLFIISKKDNKKMDKYLDKL